MSREMDGPLMQTIRLDARKLDIKQSRSTSGLLERTANLEGPASMSIDPFVMVASTERGRRRWLVIVPG